MTKTDLEHTRQYRRNDDVYTRTPIKQSPIFPAMIAAYLLTPFPTTSVGILVLLVAWATHSLLGAAKIRLDISERVMYVSPSILRQTTAVPFDDFIGFEQLQTISMFQPISVCLRYRVGEEERSSLLCCTYFNRTAEAAARETEAIIGCVQSDNTRQAVPSNAFNSPSASSRTP